MRRGRQKEKQGAYLTRIAAIYLIWDPVKHKRMMIASGGPQSKEDRRQAGGVFPLSIGKSIQKTRKEHEDCLSEFESILSGTESAMKGGGLGPERMTHDELFLEIKRALSPLDPDPTPLKDNMAAVRETSAREKLASISILGQTESYLKIDGVLWTFMSVKIPPDGTYPGILRQLMTIGFPLVVSTQIVIPDQRVVLDRYKKKFRKMQAAQKDSKGNLRVDVTAQVATQEVALNPKAAALKVTPARCKMSADSSYCSLCVSTCFSYLRGLDQDCALRKSRFQALSRRHPGCSRSSEVDLIS